MKTPNGAQGRSNGQDTNHHLELWWRLASVQRQVARGLNRALLRGRDHPATWIDVLIALAETPQGQIQTMDLAVKLGSRRSLTVLLNRMAGAGLIRREPHPTDRRALFVILTPHGRHELRRALPLYRDAIRQTGLGSLTDAEGHTLERLLAKVGNGEAIDPLEKGRGTR